MYDLFMYVLYTAGNINLSDGTLIRSEHEISIDCKSSFSGMRILLVLIT